MATQICQINVCYFSNMLLHGFNYYPYKPNMLLHLMYPLSSHPASEFRARYAPRFWNTPLNDANGCDIQVELPPDIHPLPDSVTDYVSNTYPELQALNAKTHPVCLSVHTGTPCCHFRIFTENYDSSSHGPPRSLSAVARERQGTEETRCVTKNRAWFRTTGHGSCSHQSFYERPGE